MEADLIIVWQGAVALCEQTEFEEPVMVYSRGTPINLYQIMMDTDIPFKFRAIRPDEYDWVEGATKVQFNDLFSIRRQKIAFNEHRYRPWDFP